MLFFFWLAAAAPASHAGAQVVPKVGDTCVLTQPVRLEDPKKKPIPLAKGATLNVTAEKKGKLTVSSGGKTGSILTKALTGKCAPPALAVASNKPKDDIALDMAAPVVKTQTQAEATQAQVAASRPVEPSEAEVELTLPPGRAATLVYTPLLGGGGADQVLPAVDRRLPQVLASIESFGTRAGPSVVKVLEAESPKCRIEDACLARVGKKLKADAVLAGALSLHGDNYRLELRLVDPKSGKVSDSVNQEFPNKGLQSLIDDVTNTVRVAVRQLIIEEFGRISVKVSEEGALIRLDGRSVARSPMQARSVPPGDHTLDVELQGYASFHQKVTVDSLDDLAIDVQLEHDDAFKLAYKTHAMLTRKIMWGMLGTGGVGALAAVGFFVGGTVINNNAYNKYVKPGKPLTDAQLNSVNHANNLVGVFDALTITAAVVGVVGLGAAAILYLSGDDPHKYDSAPAKPGTVAWHLEVQPLGLAVVGSF